MAIFIYNDPAPACGGDDYKFRGARGATSWPKQKGTFLGPAGAWNILWRLGYRPAIVKESSLLGTCLPKDLLVVSASGSLSGSTLEALRSCLTRGVRILGDGDPSAWQPLLPTSCRLIPHTPDHPYVPFAWTTPTGTVELLAPERWLGFQLDSTEGATSETWGQLAEVHGETQTPRRAAIKSVPGAPAMVRFGNLTLLNGTPFAGFQAWLQGQADLGPFLEWRHRAFWLDEWVAFLWKALGTFGLLDGQEQVGIKELGSTTVVLRHDLDSSRDTSYLEEDKKAGLSGVHAVLLDDNTNYWLRRLRTSSAHETAFHYRSSSPSFATRVMRRLGMPGSERFAEFSMIAGTRLLKQIDRAQKAGIPIQTVHRHYSHMAYPEWIDALDAVFQKHPDVLGSSSAFSGQVLRWGATRVDNINGTIGFQTDPQHPYWYPFRLSHAGNGGELLRGWESTSVMELEVDHVQQLLDYWVDGLQQKVITLNYHPAHANRPTLYRNGTLSGYQKVLELIRERHIEVRTLSGVYAAASRTLAEKVCEHDPAG